MREIASPEPTPDEVRIRVRAFSLNRAEAYLRAGRKRPITAPRVPGIEAVGEIVDDPAGVFRTGERVATAMEGMQFTRELRRTGNRVAQQCHCPGQRPADIGGACSAAGGLSDRMGRTGEEPCCRTRADVADTRCHVVRRPRSAHLRQGARPECHCHHPLAGECRAPARGRR
ncbi:alcohol dehydrogenase catalytic domain-containing protein [Cupriavidus sp. SK-4]|uniref:alcohol dehydrogenase catalytic domain-containing protein n=1 Tax=Cupriavidus sp. SK-4 TaxID=574750 RepID=UPI00350F2571